jgi:glycosyltransferase involved in cell wall biosynthesis
LRVAFLSVGDTGRLTGGYRYNARVIGGLRARGVEVDEVIPCGASPEEQGAASGDDPLHDHREYDVIVVDALSRIVICAHLDGWRADRPVVALIHELQSLAGPPKDAKLERFYERPLLRADALITVSGHGAGILRSRGVPAERIRVVHPGSDAHEPGVKNPTTRDTSGPRVLCVAQWIPRKGVLELARTWGMIRSEGAVLEFIGEVDADPDYSARVREIIGDDASVVVRGPVGDAEVRSAYGTADVFALPSRYEGYGVVYAEALRFGLPIVACDVGPVPKLVGAEAALLVSPDDPAALADTLERVTGDPALRTRMSRAARRRAAGLPRWEDTARGFHEVLREAVRADGLG